MDIEVTGEIVSNDEKWLYDWYELDSFCPNDMKKALDAANGEDVTVRISSPGGLVKEASEIRSMLKAYSGDTRAVVTGVAASAATIIMTGADKVEAYATAVIMIHSAATVFAGNAEEFGKQKEVLEEIDKSIAHAYAEKTGKSLEECLEMMKRETWMAIDKAMEYGLVDGVVEGENVDLAAVATITVGRITNKMKQLATDMAKQKQSATDTEKEDSLLPLKPDDIADMVMEKLETRKKKEQDEAKNEILKDLDLYGTV